MEKIISTSNQKKYQVFISSTFKDLTDHRNAAARGIINAGHLPTLLENFPPDTHDKSYVIKKAIKACQYYVLILGATYGSRPVGDDGVKLQKGYVEMELDWAIDNHLEILAFILNDDIARKSRCEMNAPHDEEEKKNEERYWGLRERFTNVDKYFYKPYSTPNEIYIELYAYFFGDHDVRGYILEPEYKPESTFMEIYAEHEILRNILLRISNFGIYEKLADSLYQKESIANAFNELYGEDISQKCKKIFIESGSTTSYIAKTIASNLPKKTMLPSVVTNNALAYIYLWLCEGVMCHSEPDGPPDDRYGGMYGPLTGRNRKPDYSLPPLKDFDPKGLVMIEELNHKIFSQTENDSKTLILAAISGLQISNDIKAINYETKLDITDIKILTQLQECFGFHVGSYQNKLFKRCLNLSKVPTIVFLHDKKIDCTIEVGKCHFIFDKEETWANFITEHPLSLWIGCCQETACEILSKCKDNFKEGDWLFGLYGDFNLYPIVIGHNKKFREMWKEAGILPYREQG